MIMKTLTAVILAAGESKRMRGSRPKALHLLGGRRLIDYSVRIARALGARIIVVVGRGADDVRAAVGESPDLTFVEQKERLGTAHALLQARGACGEGAGDILVLPGDQPLMSEGLLRALVDHHRSTAAAATLLTAEVEEPAGYGRVIREGGRPVAIIEHRDATAAQRVIREIGTSTYCFDARSLWPALDRVTPQNDQGEHYLTDAVSILASSGAPVEALAAPHPEECLGINDRKQLAEVATRLRRRTLERLMIDGVTILDPAATYVDDTVTVGADTVIYPGAVLEGATAIGTECVVGTGCQVSGSRIGDRVTLRPYCVLSDAVVDAEAQLGPFCHLRPQSHVGAGAKVGNFVELKKAKIGRGAKVPHLSYVGDATVGDNANIGAGTITCNYDGAAKHETMIGPGAFVGTNSSLVAPVTIGAGAYVGAGSVITKSVPDGALAVARARQEVRPGWVARKEKTRKAKG